MLPVAYCRMRTCQEATSHKMRWRTLPDLSHPVTFRITCTRHSVWRKPKRLVTLHLVVIKVLLGIGVVFVGFFLHVVRGVGLGKKLGAEEESGYK